MLNIFHENNDISDEKRAAVKRLFAEVLHPSFLTDYSFHVMNVGDDTKISDFIVSSDQITMDLLCMGSIVDIRNAWDQQVIHSIYDKFGIEINDTDMRIYEFADLVIATKRTVVG